MSFTERDIQAAFRNVQDTYRGPGGAIAVVRNDESFTSSWGFADLERRIPMSKAVQIPICSISKQMLVLAILDLLRNPTASMLARKETPEKQLEDQAHEMLPHLADVKEGPVTLANLWSMQSGIRDYWAMTTLWGARPEDPFSLTSDALRSLQRTKSLQFEAGSEYSYSNVNFYVLARAAEKVAGQSLSQLLAERVFIKAGMSTALLSANTFGHPLPIVGYEGDEKHGYIPATNRIEWSGDAGIAASLEDMVAYEKWLHESYDDASSTYRTMTETPAYKDGTPAYYGFGLMFGEVGGKQRIGHAGALRGYRLHRVHLPTEKLSVVVLFNHEADSGAAALEIVKRLLKAQDPPLGPPVQAAPEWYGSYLDESTQLLVRVKHGKEKGELLIQYAEEESATLASPTHAESRSMHADIDGNMIHIRRLHENRTLHARRIAENGTSVSASDFSGEYYCADAMSTLRCSGEGKLMYGAFDGYLGSGPVNLMRYVGETVWTLGTPRGLDAPAPGDWTVVFHRDADGRVAGASVGCWLARRLQFVKVSS